MDSLFYPQSVALIGASEGNSFHQRLYDNCIAHGYQGQLFFVNPGRSTVFGKTAYKTVRDLPSVPDCAVISVRATRLIDVVAESIAVGIKMFIVNTAGLERLDDTGTSIEQRLVSLLENSGSTLVGPNCLGVANLHNGAVLFGAEVRANVHKGDVGLIAQSGSAVISLLSSDLPVGYSKIVSSGNELSLNVEDYLETFVDDPSIGVIGIYLEELSDYQRFKALTQRAKLRGKPIVALKLGQSERGRSVIASHTGSIASPGEIAEAALRDAGVVQVSSMDQLVRALYLSSKASSANVTDKIGAAAFSGGQLSLFADTSERVGLPISDIAPETKAVLAHKFKVATGDIDNPVDVGEFVDAQMSIGARYVEVVRAFDDDPNIQTILIIQDAQRTFGEHQVAFYSQIFREIADGTRNTQKPIFLVSPQSQELHPDLVECFRDSKIATLSGLDSSLSAIRAISAQGGARKHKCHAESELNTNNHNAVSLHPMNGTRDVRSWDEPTLLKLFERYGISTPRPAVCLSADEAVQAASKHDFDVVLKIVSPAILHKSDIGGVRFADGTPAAVKDAFEKINESVLSVFPDIDPVRISVSPRIDIGREMILGAVTDPTYGAMVYAGVGGLDAELLDTGLFFSASICEACIRQLLRASSLSRYVERWRGDGELSFDEFLDTSVAFAAIARDYSNIFASIEINPINIGFDGVVALDGAAVLHEDERTRDGDRNS